MKEHELQAIKDAVADQVRETVNGKIDKVREHLERQDVKLEAMEQKIDELKPVSEGIVFIRTVRAFLMWAAPAGAILLGIYKWILK